MSAAARVKSSAMTATVPRLPATQPIETITEALLDAGAIIVTDFLDPLVLARLNAELTPHFEAAQTKPQGFINEGYAAFYGPYVRHVLAVAEKSNTFVDEVLCHPIYVGLGQAILGPSCKTFQLNVAHGLERGPGAAMQHLHRDEVVWPDLGPAHPHREISSVIALGDFTAEMGATLVVPGSHKWDRARKPQPDEIVAAEMSPGSAVIYLGGAIHAGGPNTSDRRRRGLHVSYTLGWLRTEENNYLAISRERVRALSPLAQTLLGFAAHDGLSMGLGYLGAVDLRDPVDLFAEGKL